MTFDTRLPRPTTFMYVVQGTKGIWSQDGNAESNDKSVIYLDGVSPQHQWEHFDAYQEKYEHPLKKLHLGTELDLHYAAFRLGLNQGYPTAGLGIRLGIFCLDYVYFTRELGYYPGQFPQQKHVLSLGVGFDVPRPHRENEFSSPVEEEEPIRKPRAKAKDAPPPVQEISSEKKEQPVVNEPVEAKKTESPKEEVKPAQPSQQKPPEPAKDDVDWE